MVSKVGNYTVRYSRIIFLLLLTALIAAPAPCQSIKTKFQVLEALAQRPVSNNFATVSAKLLLGTDKKQAYRELDTLLSKEYGDMFWMYECAGLYFVCKDVLPSTYKQKIRSSWKACTPYRGDTENHFLMYYGSLLLMSEEWDSLPASEWFMGRSSKEIQIESSEWLDHWIDQTIEFGMVEYDSPRYLYYYITPLVLLSEFCKDSTLRMKSSMMLETLLAEYASKYDHGSYAGSHSRESNESALVQGSSEVSSFGEYFFEDSVTHVLPDLVFVAASDYQVPEIVSSIAHDHKWTYTCENIIRSRYRIRNEAPPVRSMLSYTYVTPSYSIGSIEGGIAQPIQQRTWLLTINGAHKYSSLFGLHPYSSAYELGTFFPEEPSFMFEKIDAVKNGYTSPDKWVGGSPFEHVWQRENQLFCTYDIPKNDPVQHVDLFIPDWGVVEEADSSVWREFIIRYDSIEVRISTSADFSLMQEAGGYRMRVPVIKEKAGYWIYVRNINENEKADPNMFRGNNVFLKGRAPKWVFNSPFMESEYGSGILRISCGGREQILNFKIPNIREH